MWGVGVGMRVWGVGVGMRVWGVGVPGYLAHKKLPTRLGLP